MRVPGIEVLQKLNPELYQRFRQGVLDAVDLMPDEWHGLVFPEVCGSFAFMFSKPWSDIDLNLGTEDPMDLVALNHTFNLSKTIAALTALGFELGVTISPAARSTRVTAPESQRRMKEAGFSTYPVFDLQTETWFGKEAWDVFPHTLRWDRPQRWWKPAPPKVLLAGSGMDPLEEEQFADDIVKYRDLYGAYYLEAWYGDHHQS